MITLIGSRKPVAGNRKSLRGILRSYRFPIIDQVIVSHALCHVSREPVAGNRKSRIELISGYRLPVPGFRFVFFAPRFPAPGAAA